MPINRKLLIFQVSPQSYHHQRPSLSIQSYVSPLLNHLFT